jgi:hypothetical protein
LLLPEKPFKVVFIPSLWNLILKFLGALQDRDVASAFSCIFTKYIAGRTKNNTDIERYCTVSRDGYFFEGLNILFSTFCLCADGFQGLSKAFHYLVQYHLFRFFEIANNFRNAY